MQFGSRAACWRRMYLVTEENPSLVTTSITDCILCRSVYNVLGVRVWVTLRSRVYLFSTVTVEHIFKDTTPGLSMVTELVGWLVCDVTSTVFRERILSQFHTMRPHVAVNKLEDFILFMTLNHQNAHTYSSYVCITISHWIFLHDLVRMEPSSGNQTKKFSIKTN